MDRSAAAATAMDADCRSSETTATTTTTTIGPSTSIGWPAIDWWSDQQQRNSSSSSNNNNGSISSNSNNSSERTTNPIRSTIDPDPPIKRLLPLLRQSNHTYNTIILLSIIIFALIIILLSILVLLFCLSILKSVGIESPLSASLFVRSIVCLWCVHVHCIGLQYNNT